MKEAIRELDMDRYEKAVDRWLAILNGNDDREAVEAAFNPSLRIDRYGWADNRDSIQEVIEGIDGVCEWLTRPPPGLEFTRDGSFELHERNDRPVARVRYRLEIDDFVGGGEWAVELDDDGRIVWLEHRPDDLKE